MNAPIFSICAASLVVQGVIGTNPVKFFPAGDVPAGTQRPYATYQNIGGQPENYLADVPDVDQFIIQVSCYADTQGGAHQVALALRDAIEPHAYISAWRGDGRDPVTKSYSYIFDVDWIVSR